MLKSGSVEAVSIANNHSEDYFEEGMKDTQFILDENKINYFGLGKDAVVDVKGIKVGLLGYNGLSTEYNEKNLKQMEDDIKSLKKKSDVVVVYFHWGIELDYYPDKKQKDFAHYAIDKGADLVMGSHPHVIQGIEKYKNKYIAYSLGNFCFGGNKNPSDTDSYIYQQTFTFSDNKLTSIKEPNIIPTSITSSNSRNNYQPKILDGSEKDRVLNKLEKISKDLNK
ncbi:CapA family protein [Clostridioides difficile]|nr:CapA family protein [Clostridioides difficile]MCG3621916.1 CapA family protein [Clostridioides difficile]MCI4242629.1 CapA family protein [Clostridioides difficile]MDB9601679.1 CapA family protein [Clostridioides difficile]MDW0103753.1 CapA family protein [Clostridioides difficile]